MPRAFVSAGLAFLAAVALAAGCAHNPPRVYGAPGASPAQETPWVPPAKAIAEQEKAERAAAEEAKKAPPLIPAELLKNIQNLSLADIVDIALRNSKQTRQAWEQALSAAAAYGSRRGTYFPQISANADENWQKNPVFGGRIASGLRTFQAVGSVTWLLTDFGGRHAQVEGAREALLAADWSHNTAIQSVILEVEQAYYNYFAAKALMEAQQATVNEADTNESAAEERHKMGVATIADVLQARTALSQATLVLETLQGQILTTRGALATAMGLPANAGFDVELPIGSPPVQEMTRSVEEYLQIALRKRPDLSAARAQALQAEAGVRAARSQMFPSITASGDYGTFWLTNLTKPNPIYDFTIALSLPLFTGFSHLYDIKQAKADAAAARAAADNLADLITLQVWTSYYNLQTANQTVRTSDDLMASAKQNQEVAAGRYKAGVGSVLDLLTAEAALASARAQQIQARADWWLAVAQLAHDTGTLEVSALRGQGKGLEPSTWGGDKEGGK